MSDRNPLIGVFSAADLARVKAGKCLVSNADADECVVISLTDDGYGNRLFRDHLATWFSVAEAKGCGDYFRHELRGRVNDHLQFDRCAGELAAGYFVYRRLDPEAEFHFPTAGPDILFASGGQQIKCEVKTAVGGLPPGRFCGAVASRAPVVRRLLSQSTRQLRPGDPNLVLIVDFYRPPIMEFDVQQALYGTFYLTKQMGPDGPVPGDWQPARGRDGKCGPDQTTRLSALGVLHWRQDVFGYFVHNSFAVEPIRPEVLDPWSQYVYDGWRNQTPSDPIPGITDCY